MALPGPSLGRGAGAMTRGYASFDDGSAPCSWCEKAANKTERGKQKHQKESTRTTLAASRPEKGLRRGE